MRYHLLWFSTFSFNILRIVWLVCSHSGHVATSAWSSPIPLDASRRFTVSSLIWEQGAGSRDSAVVRALASHRCGSGSILELNAICGLSLLLVLFSVSRGFSPGTPVFPSPQKPTFPNSNSIQISVDEWPLCGGATENSYSYSIVLIAKSRFAIPFGHK